MLCIAQLAPMMQCFSVGMFIMAFCNNLNTAAAGSSFPTRCVSTLPLLGFLASTSYAEEAKIEGEAFATDEEIKKLRAEIDELGTDDAQHDWDKKWEEEDKELDMETLSAEDYMKSAEEMVANMEQDSAAGTDDLTFEQILPDAERMTPSDKQPFKVAFDKADSDKNGRLNTEELGTLFTEMEKFSKTEI
mmetsp:Transcript_82675/g.164150  ORF Transcript_82675/g.164150 Transcript_82675/m.164150 type:complete len:190 (-) Transcript_82675:74-643(-)